MGTVHGTADTVHRFDEGIEALREAVVEAAAASWIGRPPTKRTRAEAFLIDRLVGPMPAKQMVEEARELGISPRTLDRARAKLGVDPFRPVIPGPWYWRLPAGELRAPEVPAGEPRTPEVTAGQAKDARIRPRTPQPSTDTSSTKSNPKGLTSPKKGERGKVLASLELEVMFRDWWERKFSQPYSDSDGRLLSAMRGLVGDEGPVAARWIVSTALRKGRGLDGGPLTYVVFTRGSRRQFPEVVTRWREAGRLEEEIPDKWHRGGRDDSDLIR